MHFAVIVSKQDAAGLNIASFLQTNLSNNLCLHFIEGNQCFADNVNELDADFFIFASRHKSDSGKPTLSTHCIGNWGKAELGGKDCTLVPANSFLLKNYLIALQKQKEEKQLQYEVCLEVSHHGPALTKPTVFIELGSSEAQWKDKQAAQAVAEVVINSTSLESSSKPAIGIGGGHYCPEFSKLVLRTEYALGHICPGYALQHFDSEMLQKAIDCTLPKPEAIIFDEKGLGKEGQRIKQLLASQQLPVLRLRKLLG